MPHIKAVVLPSLMTRLLQRSNRLDKVLDQISNAPMLVEHQKDSPCGKWESAWVDENNNIVAIGFIDQEYVSEVKTGKYPSVSIKMDFGTSLHSLKTSDVPVLIYGRSDNSKQISEKAFSELQEYIPRLKSHEKLDVVEISIVNKPSVPNAHVVEVTASGEEKNLFQYIHENASVRITDSEEMASNSSMPGVGAAVAVPVPVSNQGPVQQSGAVPVPVQNPINPNPVPQQGFVQQPSAPPPQQAQAPPQQQQAQAPAAAEATPPVSIVKTTEAYEPKSLKLPPIPELTENSSPDMIKLRESFINTRSHLETVIKDIAREQSRLVSENARYKTTIDSMIVDTFNQAKSNMLTYMTPQEVEAEMSIYRDLTDNDLPKLKSLVKHTTIAMSRASNNNNNGRFGVFNAPPPPSAAPMVSVASSGSTEDDFRKRQRLQTENDIQYLARANNLDLQEIAAAYHWMGSTN